MRLTDDQLLNIERIAATIRGEDDDDGYDELIAAAPHQVVLELVQRVLAAEAIVREVSKLHISGVVRGDCGLCGRAAGDGHMDSCLIARAVEATRP
jgi:hypothetical protein